MFTVKQLTSILSVKSCCSECLRHCHPYKFEKLNSYTLADQLIRNLIYNKDGIVVLNKPYGISFAQNVDVKETGVSLSTIHPYLMKALGWSELYSAKVPEKYATGVAIFCKNESTLKRVQKCFKYMRGTKVPAEFFECVVIGQPTVLEAQFEGGITIEQRGPKKGIKFVEECSKSSVRNSLVKNLKIQHSTLSVGDCASRLTISATRTKWNSVRAYASSRIVSPILGDHVFGRFVRTVLGKPVLISTFSSAAEQPQTLPKELLERLELSSRKDIEIPLHLHLSRVELMNFFGKSKHLEFTAAPPDYFKWTCEILNLREHPSNEAVVQ